MMMVMMMLVLITRACVRCQNPVGDAREVPTRSLWSEYDHDHHDYDHDDYDNVMLTMLLMIAVILQLSDWKLASMNKGGVGGLLLSSLVSYHQLKWWSYHLSCFFLELVSPLSSNAGSGLFINQGDSLCSRCQLKLLPRDKNYTQMQWNTNALTVDTQITSSENCT